MTVIQERTLDIFRKTISENSELFYEGRIDEINHFNLLMEAGGKNAIHKLLGCNMCMVNSEYEEEPAILIIFSIPINQKTGSKHIADRVMEIVENAEACFTTLDYTNSKEQRDEKFIYVTIIKKIGELVYEKEAC